MTEDTGFPESTEVPPLAEEPALETPAEPAPDVETPAEAEPAEEPSAPPEPPPAEAPPFVPDQGVADWLREGFASFHRRLTNLGG